MYWTSFTKTTASIQKAKMNGAHAKDKPIYSKDRKLVDLGALIVDPNGEFLYFVEKKGHKLIRFSLQGAVFTCISTFAFLLYRKEFTVVK